MTPRLQAELQKAMSLQPIRRTSRRSEDLAGPRVLASSGRIWYVDRILYTLSDGNFKLN